MVAALLKHIDRWRLFLIVFAFVYGAVLTVNLASTALVWDEVTHLSGGLLLARGQIVTWALTNSFYPPVYDAFTAVYFLVLSPTVFAARLVSVTFSVLTLFVIYETANLLYNSKKIAFVSAVLLAVMPGIIWLSRLAMIETLLLFVLSLSLFFFFRWLKNNQRRDQILSIVAFAVGVLVKYQVLVIVPLIMVIGTFFWKKDFFKSELKKWLSFPRLAVVSAVLICAILAGVFLVVSGTVDYLLYAFGVGSQQKAEFSARFPLPLYYLLEMTRLDDFVHPISLLLYGISLVGLGYLAYRRKGADKQLLLWFIVVYVVFTLIPNREWRYVTIAFPVLAIAASNLVVGCFDRIRKPAGAAKNRLAGALFKIGALALIGLTVAGVFYSCADAATWQQNQQVSVPVGQATNYVAQHLGENQTVAIACPVNHFNKYTVAFYLSVNNPNSKNQTWQYPNSAADSFIPNFNTKEFIDLCNEHNAKYVMIYEYWGNKEYFNTTLTEQQIYGILNATDVFPLEATFGVAPNRVFVLNYKAP
jgi:4-amino-4-deoxy-L-arabinose transferase-like glycosyltransferase